MRNASNPGPEYLKAEDFAKDNVFKEFDLVIKEAIPPGQVRAADGNPINKPILVFAGNVKKRMIVGKLNERLLTYATGTTDMAGWAGKKIRLRVCILEKCLGQTNVATIRVALPNTATKPFITKGNYGMVATGMPMSAEQAAIAKQIDSQNQSIPKEQSE